MDMNDQNLLDAFMFQTGSSSESSGRIHATTIDHTFRSEGFVLLLHHHWLNIYCESKAWACFVMMKRMMAR